MTVDTEFEWRRVPLADATAWVEEGLADGGALAAALAGNLDPLTDFFVLVPAHADVTWHPREASGYRMTRSAIELGLARMLRSAEACGARTIIVEDELGRRGDPVLTTSAAAAFGVRYMGDRVVRSQPIRADLSAAIRIIRTGSSGYPLNGFLTEFELPDSDELALPQLDGVLRKLVGILVSAFDAETYAVLARPDLGSHLDATVDGRF